jgi:hypothetical protein
MMWSHSQKRRRRNCDLFKDINEKYRHMEEKKLLMVISHAIKKIYFFKKITNSDMCSLEGVGESRVWRR